VVESLVIGRPGPGEIGDVARGSSSSSFARALPSTRPEREDQGAHTENTTPRHVPAKVLQVPGHSAHKSNKIVDSACARGHGRPVKERRGACEPEALEHFRNRPEARLSAVGKTLAPGRRR